MFHKSRRGRGLNVNEYGMDDNGDDVVGNRHARRAIEKEKEMITE